MEIHFFLWHRLYAFDSRAKSFASYSRLQLELRQELLIPGGAKF